MSILKAWHRKSTIWQLTSGTNVSTSMILNKWNWDHKFISLIHLIVYWMADVSSIFWNPRSYILDMELAHWKKCRVSPCGFEGGKFPHHVTELCHWLNWLFFIFMAGFTEAEGFQAIRVLDKCRNIDRPKLDYLKVDKWWLITDTRHIWEDGIGN